MSEVFIAPRGQLGRSAKQEMRAAGIVVVEVDDPTSCKFIRSTETIEPDDMLWAALDALRVDTGNYGRDQRERLATNLFRIVAESRKARGAFVHQPKKSA